jgi:membrane-bound lytic murein transglycosylase B
VHQRYRLRRLTLRVSAVSLLLLGGGLRHAHADEGGWSYLIDKLAADGVDPRRAREVFRDPRMPRFTVLEFGLYQAETSALYRGFRSAASIARARQCRVRFARELEAAEERYRVDASVVAAIFHVETSCGLNRGRHVALYRLARLAMANEPANLRHNLSRHLRGAPPNRRAQTEARTRERGKYLEDTFYPEVLATFRVAERQRIDPLGIVGSGSGAFGIPQFLPGSYLRFGVDGNGNGRVSLHEPADAAFSAANYLAGHGWRPGLSSAEQRTVIWTYNRSGAYIDTILALSEAIRRGRN